jgi:hypothetical protein
MRSTLLQVPEYSVTHILTFEPQLAIPKSNCPYSERGQEPFFFLVSRSAGRVAMSRAVQFDCEPRFLAEEIQGVNPSRVLASKFIGAKTSIPEPAPHESFCPRGVFPKRSNLLW